MNDVISIRGARTHNLKQVNVDIPRNKLVVVTGLSGSGKSSLAFDTLFAEGQRRYVESLSTYARQFLSMMEKPDVDSIEGLSPAISIEQKAGIHNPRSTVGTTTEIYDYLRLLYARIGTPYCPTHQVPLKAQTISQMVDTTLALPAESKIMLLAPVVNNRRGEHSQLLEQLKRKGFIRILLNGEVYELDYALNIDPKARNSIEVVVDRLVIRSGLEQRLAESFETALGLSEGIAKIRIMSANEDYEEKIFSSRHACPKCGHSVALLEPRLFSFNNPNGACSACDGLGMTRFFDPERIVVDQNLSITDGAIPGWDKQSKYYFQLLKSVAEHYDFDINTPWDKLLKEHQQIILTGSGRTKIKLSRLLVRGRITDQVRRFEGIIPNMERRYQETESDQVREELSKYITYSKCPTCEGSRLCETARNVYINNTPLNNITDMPIDDAYNYFCKLKLPKQSAEIAERILNEIQNRLHFLLSVGLNYLTLSRTSETLSGGEAQRIRLASQIGSGLVGVMYILDEPSIGLHQRDNQRLLNTLTKLRDIGNTVIVVEHDEDAILHADHVIDIGPGAGIHGGQIIAEGPPSKIKNHPTSLTGMYLNGKKSIAIPDTRQKPNPDKVICITQAECNNLNKVTAEFPIGLMTCVTGVSGSGKSSLINETLFPLAHNQLVKNANKRHAGTYAEITGLEHLDKVVDIDQSPIGRTPRSNPATYTGLFTPIRELFAATAEARSRGYKSGRFSFNVSGGRCEACEGGGLIRVEMHFLADVYVTCDVCQGKRYNRETLTVVYKGKTIAEILAMTVEVAAEFFSAIPNLARKLQTLIDVGLGYIHLGQSATTLSGGEAQRIKLSKELSKKATGKTLYILDEPTTGLHFHDINKLLEVLHRLRDHGNTVIVIEHNLDVIKTADWIIDLGPEGGAGGGNIIATGTPEQVQATKASYTGVYLKKMLHSNT